jgi:hypothetical protein
MPIKRYLEKGVVFDPQALSAMSRALEEATEILRIRGDEKQRETVAKFIIRLAQRDGDLDATAMRDTAVAALGGIAYSAVCGASQTSSPRAAAE